MFLTYTVKFDKSLMMNETLVENKIKSVLQDPRGWLSHGYIFEQVDKGYKSEGYKSDKRYKSDGYKSDIIIKIVPAKTVEKICSFKGLSCADISNNTIYINVNRWKRGSKHSKLNLDNYRIYLVNHEIGHLLGRGHSECLKNNSKVPVMVQQTLGIGKCKPNPWPLSWE